MKQIKRSLAFLFAACSLGSYFACFSMNNGISSIENNNNTAWDQKLDFYKKREIQKVYTFDRSAYKAGIGTVCPKLRFFAIANNKKVEVRAVYDRSLCFSIACKGNSKNLIFNATGTYLGILSSSGLQLWDLFGGFMVSVRGGKKTIYFEFSPCGQYLLYLRKNFGKKIATVLHIKKNKELLTCRVHKDFFCKFVGDYAFFTDKEENILIYDLHQKNRLYHITGCINLKLNYPSEGYFVAELEKNEMFLLGDMRAAAQGQGWLHIFKGCSNVLFSPHFHKPDLPSYKYSVEERNDNVKLKRLDDSKQQEHTYDNCEGTFFDGISGKSFVIMKKDGTVIFKKLNEDNDGYTYKCNYADVALSFCGNYSTFLKSDGSIETIDLNNLSICEANNLPGTSVLLRSDEKTMLFELTKGEPIFECQGYYHISFFDLKKFNDKFILFSKEDEETIKKEYILFDMQAKKVICNYKEADSFELHESKGAIVFDLNGDKELWSLRDRKRIYTFKDCKKLRFGPYGDYLLAFLKNNSLELYKKQSSQYSFRKNMNNLRKNHKKYLDSIIKCHESGQKNRLYKPKEYNF